MADTTIKKEGLPIDYELRGYACSALMLETTATDSGYKDICLGGGFGKAFYDRSYIFDAGFERTWRNGKLFADGGAGSTSRLASNLFVARVGKNGKSPFANSLTVKDGAWEVVSEKVSGFGWQNVGGEERDIGGAEIGLPSDVRGLLYFGSRFGGGVQYYLDGSRWYLEPMLTIDQGTYYPLVSQKEQGERPGSSQEIAVGVGLKVGFGDQNSESRKNKLWDIYDDIHAYYGDTTNYLGRALRYAMYDSAVEGENSFYDDIGVSVTGSSQQTEDVVLLLAAQSVFKGFEISEFVSSCYDAHSSGSSTCGVRLAARGIGGIVTALGGKAMLTDAIGDLSMVAGGLLTYTDIDMRTQMLIEGAAGAAVQMVGVLAGSREIGMSGMNWLTSVAWSPDRRGSALSEKFLWDVRIKPYNLNLMGAQKGHPSASIEKRVYVDVTDPNRREEMEKGLYTNVELETHAIYPQNIAGRFENVAGGSKPYVLNPTMLRAGAGYTFKPSRYFKLSMGGHLFNEVGGSGAGGVGADVTAEAAIPIGGFIKEIDFGTGLMGEQGVCSGPACSFKLQVPFMFTVVL